MNNGATSRTAAMAIELLRREGCGVAMGMRYLLDELADKAPDTAIELLNLVDELITDPRIQQVPDHDSISFAWAGQSTDSPSL